MHLLLQTVTHLAGVKGLALPTCMVTVTQFTKKAGAGTRPWSS